MKPAFVAAGVVVAACAVYLGAAVVSGQKVEKHLRAMTAATQADWPMIKVTDEHYQHGLLAATHTFTLRPACDVPDAGASAPQAAITIVQHVKHGPFPGFGGFGAATVDTELQMDAASRQEVAKLFGTGQPFQAHTDVAFSGATRTHFSVARFHVAGPDGQQMDFQGVTGDIDNDDHALEYDVRMPAMSVEAAASAPAAVHMALKGMHVHGRAEGAGDLALRPGKSQGELQAFELAMVAPGGSGAHKMGFGPIKFSQDTTFDKSLMTATGRAEGTGQFDETRLDRFELQSTMKRVDAVAYRGLVQRFVNNDPATCGKAPDPAKLFASQEVQAALMQMLSANPELSLDKLVVEIGGKRAELGYAVGVEGFTPADAKLPLQLGLMTKGYGNLRVKLPEEWVQKSMAYVAQQSGQSSGAADQAAMVELMLGKVVDQGYVVREDGMLRSELAYKGGRATINGKPLGVPGAGQPAVTPTAAAM